MYLLYSLVCKGIWFHFLISPILRELQTNSYVHTFSKTRENTKKTYLPCPFGMVANLDWSSKNQTLNRCPLQPGKGLRLWHAPLVLWSLQRWIALRLPVEKKLSVRPCGTLAAIGSRFLRVELTAKPMTKTKFFQSNAVNMVWFWYFWKRQGFFL